MISLEVFLKRFVGSMNDADIKHCVLRNYEELPVRNNGNDIDFLIPRERLLDAINLIFSVEKASVTSLVERQCVTSIFLTGVHWGEGRKGIQIDLITSFFWKGIPFLGADSVLDNVNCIPSSNGLLNRPSLHHEAIISFFSSYLIGGWIKERYQQKVRRVFTNYRIEVIEELGCHFSSALAFNLVDAVIKNDKNVVLSLLNKIRFNIVRKEMQKSPFKTVKSIFMHYFIEGKIRFTQDSIFSVSFLGPDGSGKSTVINALESKLRDSVKEISYVHLKPRIKNKANIPEIVNIDPHGMQTRNAVVSTAKLVWWLILYRFDYIFHNHRATAIRIWDRHYVDVYIDPKRYRCGAPMWVAKFIGRFIPKPELFVLLDAPAKVIQARKQEVPLAETDRQRTAYLDFAEEQSNCIVLDTSIGIDETMKIGCDEILRVMKEKQLKRLHEK